MDFTNPAKDVGALVETDVMRSRLPGNFSQCGQIIGATQVAPVENKRLDAINCTEHVLDIGFPVRLLVECAQHTDVELRDSIPNPTKVLLSWSEQGQVGTRVETICSGYLKIRSVRCTRLRPYTSR